MSPTGTGLKLLIHGGGPVLPGVNKPLLPSKIWGSMQWGATLGGIFKELLIRCETVLRLVVAYWISGFEFMQLDPFGVGRLHGSDIAHSEHEFWPGTSICISHCVHNAGEMPELNA